jgi:2-aminoadipate transaminase
MDKSLRRYLPMAEYVAPQGGYFFWLRLPNIDTVELQKKARSFKVGFHSGVRFSYQKGLREFIRLSFVNYPPAEIEKGIIRLKESLDEL